MRILAWTNLDKSYVSNEASNELTFFFISALVSVLGVRVVLNVLIR